MWLEKYKSNNVIANKTKIKFSYIGLDIFQFRHSPHSSHPLHSLINSQNLILIKHLLNLALQFVECRHFKEMRTIKNRNLKFF